jgi:hypothetical protein
MLNDNAKLWVKELREGGHKQTTDGVLQNSDSFCCLGVACLVYERETGNKLPRDCEGNLGNTVLDDSFDVVRTWLGLKTCKGCGTVKEEYVNLAAINDGGMSFSKIADIIESEPEGLFCDAGRSTESSTENK